MSGALDGQVAVVTGAGAGIGEAIATALAEADATVVVVDRDETAARAASAALPRAVPAAVDVADVAAVRELVGSITAEHDRLDILVNNAAVTQASTFFEVDEQEWDRIDAVNARGAFFLMQTAARAMADRGGGRIVNIASIAGKGFNGSSSAAYAASKGAMLAMTRYAANALAADNVTVNAVCPGITETATFRQVVGARAEAAGEPYDRYVAAYAEQIPLRRVNEPADIAAAVLFLAGPGGRNVTGQSLNVDGGLVFD